MSFWAAFWLGFATCAVINVPLALALYVNTRPARRPEIQYEGQADVDSD